MVIPYLIAAIIIIGIFAFLFLFPNKKNSDSSGKKPARSKKSQAQIIRQANRHLAKNPFGFIMIWFRRLKVRTIRIYQC
ncbi:MAG: hypothetical protein II110_00245 [Treponema sp.]|nr:hypothetical protein [Treponema sp.]